MRFIEALESRRLMSVPRDADFNRDAVVNALDFGTLATNFAQSNRTFEQGDSNRDGTVNTLDFNAVAANYNGRVEMAAFRWLNTSSDGNLGNHLNYLGSPAGVPGAGDSLTIDDSDVGFLGPPTSNTGTPITALASLTIVDQNADSFSGLFNSAAISGTETFTGVGDIIIGSAASNVLGSLNGPVQITTKSGDGTINCGASTFGITNLVTAKITIGASVTDPTSLLVSTASSGSRITFNTASQGGTSGITLGTAAGLVTEIVANKTSGACNVDLSGSTLNATDTLTSQLNGVTVTDGTGGTFSNYRILSGNTLATQQTGNKPAGTAITGTYVYATGLVPYALLDAGGADMFDIGWTIDINTTAHTYSATPPITDIGNTRTLYLSDALNGNYVGLDTITVTAAATAQKANKLGLGLGGLGL